jgi:predicted nucleotidyltransferase
MESVIAARLAQIERDESARVLYAVESGSRIWGFASENSDWDIRFLYARPQSAYLGLDLPRDVIEVMEGDLDFAGWDIFKALRLLRKTNPVLIEWLWSPIVYRDGGWLTEELRAIARRYHTPVAIHYHYLSMARSNYLRYIVNPAEYGDEVSLKKYLYVMNPLCALLYYERHRQFAPAVFMTKVEGLDLAADLRARIDDLVARKRSGADMGKGSRDPVLDAWITTEMDRLAQATYAEQPPPGMTDTLNAVIARILHEETPA